MQIKSDNLRERESIAGNNNAAADTKAPNGAMKRESFTCADGRKISVCIWDGAAKPKAVLQIAHGMAEHIERYGDLAEFLNRNGIIVAGDDHRAHGHSDPETFGHCGGDIFFDTVADTIKLTGELNERFSLPVILLGHSYGSFLAQSVIAKSGAAGLKGVILMGSARMAGPVLSFGHMLAKRKVKKGKGAEKGETFAALTFKSYDKKLKEGLNAWLSFDKENVERYNADAACGFLCSNAFYESFFRGLKELVKHDNKKADKNLKLLIVSGNADPVGGNGKLVTKLYNNYKKLGFSPELKTYNARHEILNDTVKDEVHKDILSFISACVN